jgi:hypothetical protein
MNLRSIAAASAALALAAGTSASAATFGAVSITHKKSFSFTEADLFSDQGSVAAFTLPKANQNRKLLSAQWSMEYSVEASIERVFVRTCDPSNFDDDDSGSICAYGYVFYTGADVEIYEDYAFGIMLPETFSPEGEFKPYFFGFGDYFFFPWVATACLGPYEDWIIDNPTGEPFDLDACVLENSTYSETDEKEGILGPLELDPSGLAGPGVHHFLFDTMTNYGGGFPNRDVLLTGTAYITYNYGPAKPIPLPAALPLLIGGLALLGLAARRRRDD